VDDTELLTCLEVINGDTPTGDWSAKPAIPLTTVPVTNTSGRTMLVEVGANGATMTNVKIDGVIVGSGTVARTSGAFRVRNGSTITLTYSAGAPVWQWFYE
jgi:hypothetical protein